MLFINVFYFIHFFTFLLQRFSRLYYVVQELSHMMLRVLGNFDKSLKITEGDSNLHCWVGCVQVPIVYHLTMSILYRFWYIQRQMMACRKNLGQESFTVIENSTIW